ncbi:sialic acid-binding Ig-like lectin 7, partial [Tupaia chinensis]|uniref:sialic acid-binding Ig-like lectin 7 n=1 Tax=Tupaia chinensis TaxID=246437 RepID=UPI000FFCAE3E
MHLRDEGEFTCRAQHPLGSQHLSLSLSLQRQAQPGAGAMLGAIGGASVTALLFLSCCVLFLVVRSFRKKSARPSADVGAGPAVGDSAFQVSDRVSGHPASSLDTSH